MRNYRVIDSKLVCTLWVVALICVAPYVNAANAWQDVAPGIWRSQVGQKQPLDLLSAGEVTPKLQRLGKLQSTAFPLAKKRIHMELRNGRTYLRFPLARGEQLYGLGLHFQTINQRGWIRDLKVNHYPKKDTGRTHAPVPFYVSSEGYGVFINSAEPLTVYAGSSVRADADDPPLLMNRNEDDDWRSRPYSDSMEILVPADGAEVYVIGGPTPLQAVERFNLLNGGGPLPPRWGLGFVHRTPTRFSGEQIKALADEFAAQGFPLDVLGVEPGWHSSSYPNTFKWDDRRFPSPAQFVADMKSKGVELNLWFNPYLSPESPLYKKMKPLSGSHTVWNGIVPDYYLQESRDLFTRYLEKITLDIGISGFKIDEVDGYDSYLWPDTAKFPSGVTAEQQRQTYGVLMQGMADKLYRKAGRRTWGLVRASNAGAIDKPFVLYNDYYDHRGFVTALVNSGFIGVLWTPEIRKAESAEEWLKRTHSAIFSPMMMLNAWADKTMPWSFDSVTKEVKAAIDLRMELIPYIYNSFAQFHFSGTPPVRADEPLVAAPGRSAAVLAAGYCRRR